MPRQKSTHEKVRLNLEMTRETRTHLEELKMRIHAESFAEVIRRALGYFELAVETEISGGRVVLESRDGTQERIVFGLPRAP